MSGIETENSLSRTIGSDLGSFETLRPVSSLSTISLEPSKNVTALSVDPFPNPVGSGSTNVVVSSGPVALVRVDCDQVVSVTSFAEVVVPPSIVTQEKSCRWSIDVGTGHAVTIDATLVTSIVEATDLIASFAPLLSGGRTIRGLPTVQQIAAKLETLELLFNPKFSEEAANCACADFAVFPPEVIEKDVAALRRLGSLRAVIEEKHAQSASTGFCADSVRANVPPEFPKYEVLLELAENGAPIFNPPSFVPTTSPPKPRNNLGRLGNVFRYHAHKLWSSGKAVLIRWDDIPVIERSQLHFSHPHAAVKHDDAHMRFIIDPSNAPEGSCVLNSPGAKELSDAVWGVVKNPTIREIYTDMFDYCETNNCNLRDCRLWKEDVSGAFPQFRWSAVATMLMAMMIDPEHALLSCNGNFGHLSAPSIWDIIAYAILWVCLNTLLLIMGLLWKYVDDFMGFALAARASIDQQNFCRVARAILNCFAAINGSKSVLPTLRTDLLGWDTNLETELAGPNQKGRDKLLHCFCRIDVSRPQSKELWEVLASVAERYSAGLLAMKAFVSPLHHMVALFGDKSHAKSPKIATSAARQCVEVWRAVAIMLFADKEAMLVPMRQMSSLRAPNTPFSLIADAGPAGIGAGVIGPSGELVAYTSIILPFRRDVDDKFHNLREFTGLLVNLVLFVKWSRLNLPGPMWERLRGTETLVRWNSDSTSAISWVKKSKCNSRCGQHASFALTWFQLVAGITVSECTHISGDTMILSGIDALSREFPHSLNPMLYADMTECKALFDVLKLCDPSSVHDLVDHHTAFITICSLLEQI